MIDGKLVLAPIFKRSEEQLWDDVDLIFNKYNKNLDDVLSKEEITMELSRDDNANINMQDPNEEEYEKVRVHYVCAGKLNHQINSNSFC